MCRLNTVDGDRRGFENRKRTFSDRKPVINLADPRLVIFHDIFFGYSYHFRDALQPEMEWGSTIGQHPLPKLVYGLSSWRVSTHSGRQQAFKYAETNSSTEGPHLSPEQETGPVLLAVPRYPPPRTSDIIATSRWDRIVMVSTTRKLALSPCSCDVEQPQLVLSRTRVQYAPPVKNL